MNIFEHWTDLKDDIKRKRLWLFLDYDGALTPFVDRPEMAVLDHPTRHLLHGLCLYSGCKLVIVCGRAMTDIRSLVQLNRVTYIGNHGFEIEGPGIQFNQFEFPWFEDVLENLKRELRRELMFFRGAILEDKKLSLSIHYRLVNLRDVLVLESVVDEIMRPLIVKKQIRLNVRRKAFEVLPPLPWDEGKAMSWILAHHSNISDDKDMLPIFLGHSEAGEQVFRPMVDRGLAVSVGESVQTHAPYNIDRAEDVRRFLKKIYELRTDSPYD